MDKNELVFSNKEYALDVTEKLKEEGYCVMVTEEEQFTILTFIWSENHANRNDVVFAHRQVDECPKDFGFEKCFECKHGCCEFELMKDEEYNFPEG